MRALEIFDEFDEEEDLIETEHSTFFQTYSRLPIVIDSANANIIWDKNQVEYRDFLAGIAVNVLGHTHPAVLSAINHQIYRYIHASNYFYQDVQIEFAAKLAEMAGLCRVFLCNSGTEANEAAIKLVRKWGYDKNKNEIIAFTGGFHGRTYGSLSLMDKPKYKEGMGPYLSGMKIIEYNNCEQLIAAVNQNTAGVILEFIQGEGGLSCASKEFVETIIELRTKFNFLLIADEVQSGLGRTGKFSAFEHWKIQPDIATMAKGIGGGLPLGALLAKEHLAKIWKTGMHGTTFGGNPLACAAGLAVLNELENGVIQNAADIGSYFYKQLECLIEDGPEMVKEIRGQGLMLGVVFAFDASIVVEQLLQSKQIITNSTVTNVLRILPPLNITKEDVVFFIIALRGCLDTISSEKLHLQ